VLLQIELRKYLESVYGLSVASLRTLNYEGAKKRGKHGFYRRPDYKKVYVTFNKTDKAETS
jgi:large subunit ribosomal protein L23